MVDLATLIIDVLQRRFPTDKIYKFRWTTGTAIYVNDICYMGVRDDGSVHFSVMGVQKTIDHDVKLYPADPAFFDRVKALTLQNMIYYEQSGPAATETY